MRKKRIKNPRHEALNFNKRAILAMLIVVACVLTLFFRFFYLQIYNHQELLTLSEKNRIKTVSLAPARGLIYDRNGVLLVNNSPTYRLSVIPEKVDNIEEKLSKIQPLLNITQDEIDDFKEKLKYNQPFKPIVLLSKLNEKQQATFLVQGHAFIGFEAKPYLKRNYLFTNILAHVVGYVGRINEKELEELDTNRYKGSIYTGKLGIEKYYEEKLHGFPGQLTVETNVKGRVLKTIEERLPVSGKDLHLTLDINLQQKAYEALGEHTGSVIAMDPNSGEILAMVSKPGFDPNLFVNGISHKNYSALINSPEKPLFNRSIKGGYEPGSTIKPYIALAALQNKQIDLDFKMYSMGYFQLPKQERKYHDWKKGGHGTVGIEQSLAQSVNTFYYQVAVKLGIDTIHTFLDQFKFGQASGIDLLGENKGLNPSQQWKRATREMVWYPGETVITGIGQGYLTTTPIQLATALSILANRGQLITPKLDRSQASEVEPSIELETTYWDVVHSGMESVVHDIKGTAFQHRPKDYLVAGKSGTSQVYGKKEEDVYLKNQEIPKHLKNHALFIAFAPVEKPEIAIVVVAEHGHSGSKVAAPIAIDVLSHYMESKNP